MDAVLSVRNFGLLFHGMQDYLLKNVDLTVHAGEVVLVQGRNGCGKSTLLKSILQLLPKGSVKHSEGIIEVQDTVSIGFVHQRPSSQLLFFTVDEEIVAPLSFRGEDRRVRQTVADTLLQQFGIVSWKDKDPHILSSGQQQIVSILTNLSDQQKLLLLDEPFALLDDDNKNLVVNTLLRLKQKGYAILLVSHQLSTHNGLVDRSYVIREHTIIEQEHIQLPSVPTYHWHQPSHFFSAISCKIGYNYSLQEFSDLRLPATGIVLVQGKNGSGKTTFLLTLDGLLSPFEGSCKPVNIQPSIFVPQDTISFFWKPTVADEWATYSSSPLPESLAEFRLKSPFVLSEGQRKWLALQIALTADRQVVFLDEPTYSLDIPTIHNFLTLLQQVTDKLVIIATHDHLLLEHIKCQIIRLQEVSE